MALRLDETAAPPSSLDEAILSERIDVVDEFLVDMSGKDTREVLISYCKRSWVEETGLNTVARRGDVDILLSVFTKIWRRCSVQEVHLALLRLHTYYLSQVTPREPD